MRQSFILHLDSLEILEEMTLEQKGILFDAIHNFQKGKEVTLDFSMKMAFAPFKNQFLRDDEKYKETVEKRKLAGAKGGTQKQANVASATISYQDIANVADSVSVNDSDSINDNEEKEKGEISENEITSPSQKEIDLESELEKTKELIKALEEKPKTPIKKDVKIFDDLVYDFPNDFSTETKDLFMKFLANRKRMKKEVKTQRALNGLIEKLKPFDDNIRIIAIDNSINANWLDLFPKPEDRATFDHSKQYRNNGFNNPTAPPRVITQYVYDNSKD